MSMTPSNTDTELRDAILTEFQQVRRLFLADHTENCTNVVMSLIARRDTEKREALLKAVGELGRHELKADGEVLVHLAAVTKSIESIYRGTQQ